VNSLAPSSEDERVTRDILLAGVDCVIQVADAKNLTRALCVSLQLAEAGLPFVLVLNMMDEAADRGLAIDATALAQTLGVPVVSTVAISGHGLRRIAAAVRAAAVSPCRVSYPAACGEQDGARHRLRAAAQIARAVTTHIEAEPTAACGNWTFAPLAVAAALAAWGVLLAGDLGASAFDGPWARASSWSALALAGLAMFDSAPARSAFGRWSSRRGTGTLILLLVLYVVYRFVGSFGAGTAVDFLEEKLFGQYVNPAVTALVDGLTNATGLAPAFARFVRDLIVGPYGLISVGLTYAFAIVLPIVTAFFLAFSVLEDSGYLPRLAVILNRVFRGMGLNGKAVLPMVLGLGCDTMATLTARIMETRKERVLVTLLLALGVPCSAQLGVILGLFGALPGWAPLVWGGVVGGTLFAVGFLAARALPGERSDLILEIPPIRRPQLANVAVKTVGRLEWYLKEAVPIFVLGTFVLFLLDAAGVLGRIVRLGEPVVVGLLGLPAQSAEAFLIGFFRRDYGSAGIYALFEQGRLSPVQAVVALITITLFVPCVANFFVIVKEHGARTALAVSGFIFPFAFAVGGGVNALLRALGLG